MELQNVEVFKVGTHTDSAGRTRTYTAADLAHIAETYDPAAHEAPNVVGHPATNAPAFGWVQQLRVAGDKLLADFTQVPREFVEMVKAGLFKKRSISLFPDGRLRHVGWLGAAAPAVAGLKDVEFKGGEAALEYEFNDAGEVPQNMEDEGMKTLLEKLLADVAGVRVELGQIKDAGQVASFSQRLAGIETQAKDLAAGAEKAEAKAKEAEEARDKMAREFAEFKDGQVKAGRERRFEALVATGKVLPAEKEKVLSFAATLAKDTTVTMDFAAADGRTEKVSPEEAYWRDLESRQPHGLFNEFRTPAGDGGKPAPVAVDIMNRV